MLHESLINKINNAPTTCGVYLFKNKEGKIIYIGKARNLKERLKYYLSPQPDIRRNSLIREIADLDIIVTSSESDALILEDNLIKINKPKYNIRLKDDKKFPYLKITINEEYPRIFPTRNLKKDGSILFGPYTSAKNLRQALRLVKRIFKIRTCNKKLPLTIPERPCLNYRLNLCLGPCQNNVDKELYQERVKEVIEFLSGKSENLIKEIEKKMWRAAAKEDFEKAAILRNQLFALQELRKKHEVIFNEKKSMDVVGLAKEKNLAVCLILKIREGKLISKEEYPFNLPLTNTDEEILESLLSSVYLHSYDIPDEIILPKKVENTEIFIETIEKRRKIKLKITIPQRGEKKKLLSLANKNAEIKLLEILPTPQLPKANVELGNYLSLPKTPMRIEGVDISNLGGKYACGSIIVFEGINPKKSEYRRFKIKTISGQDDYGMMTEVLRRRLKRLIEENKPLPDLVLVDGGKGHLAVANKVYKEFKEDIPILAFAKKSDTLYFEDGKVISIPAYSPALKLLKRIRDEAHRFAITYHKKLRKKSLKKSILDEIKGIGEKRKLLLLNTFGSIEGIKNAKIEELAKIIPRKLAEKIHQFLQLKIH
uniref:UvrABC system protein C n=1 Tax=candidate division WOR-3 bacterium TaxID=2052148 RepID=A0A7V6CME7_UNCW3